MDDIAGLLFVGVLGIFIVFHLIRQKYRGKFRATSSTQTPVLLSYYTEGAVLMPGSTGTIGDMPYTSFVVTQSNVGHPDAIVYRVQLPFWTKSHLLGIPRHTKQAQINPAFGFATTMEQVVLEGDYPQYFSLYADKHMQHDARYVLDPTAMIFTIDFCQSHSWEIVGNDLFFVQESHANSIQAWDTIVSFVTEIRPALEKPNPNIKPKTNEYDNRTNLRCPICNTTLQFNGMFYQCVQHHGILIIGQRLMLLKKDALEPALASTTRDDALVCPNCRQVMQTKPFANALTIIDSCTHCPFNWLDADEVIAGSTA